LIWRGLLIVILVLGLVGCASNGPAPVEGWDWKGPVPRGYYLVRKGDTLGEIAQRRRLSTANLVRWNRLRPPYTVYAGKLLRVAPPGRGDLASPGRQARPGGPAVTAGRQTGPGAAAPRVESMASGSGAAASRVVWGWPIEGALIQGFSAGDPARQGVRIGCRAGEQVHAAGPGQVVYSGSGLKGYGNLIIVKHNENYLSAYGFNRRLLVKEGGSVTRGQVVAECGQGPDGASMLYFEVRRDGASVDPILYLPPRQ
jgi:lipoprotein NlpD